MIRLEDAALPDPNDRRFSDILNKVRFHFVAEITDSELPEESRYWLTAFTLSGYRLYLEARYSIIPPTVRATFENDEQMRRRACADEAHFAALHLFGDLANGSVLNCPTEVAIPNRVPDRISRDDGAFCWVLTEDEYKQKET